MVSVSLNLSELHGKNTLNGSRKQYLLFWKLGGSTDGTERRKVVQNEHL